MTDNAPIPTFQGRCPFVRAVASGDLEEAKKIAMAGDEPAEEAIVPVLIGWAIEAATEWLASNRVEVKS